jgi:ABC-type nickel/cobalt efflux system permease component RcnA
VAVAKSFGHWIDILASLALVLFGGWIAISAWREIRAEAHGGDHHHHDHDDADEHGHVHEHGHAHGHHHHQHPPSDRPGSRTALLLILGSSPMIEGIPAFFAAGRYGAPLIVVMSLVFAASTIATYVILCVGSHAGLQRVALGPLERYGEVLSGAFIAAVGVVFWVWPVL